MGDELLPCPFCGGEAKVRLHNPNSNPFFHRYEVGCDNDKCHGYYSKGWTVYSDALEEMVAAWNTRAERTCEIETYKEYGPHMEDCVWYLSCGHQSYGYKPNYCETCGAKVVDE